MEVVVQKGRGYESIETLEEEGKDVDLIAIDSIYSPIVNVSLNVSQARVGQDINYDKLSMKVETDGTIAPEEAVATASKILVDHFNLLVNEEKPKKTEKKKETKSK